MTMLNSVLIGWTGFKCWGEMWLWGQIWSILDLWPKAAILNFEKNQNFFRRLVFMIKQHAHAKFVQIRWTGSICQAKMWFLSLPPPPPQPPPPTVAKQFIELSCRSLNIIQSDQENRHLGGVGLFLVGFQGCLTPNQGLSNFHNSPTPMFLAWF